MSHEAKFKDGDLIVGYNGNTAVVAHAEPDDDGRIVVNGAENPDSEKAWEWAQQDLWTKAEQHPERWLVFDRHLGLVAFASLAAAADYAAAFGADAILHVRKDGTTEWLDIQEEG